MLKTYLKQKKISVTMLSKKCGMPYSTMHYIVNGRTPYENCSVKAFKSIADALGLTMDELYEVCRIEE